MGAALAAGAVVHHAWGQGLHGNCTPLEGSNVLRGRLEVRWIAHLHIHPEVLRKTTDKELGALTRGEPLGMAHHRLKVVGELLHSRRKG